MIHLGDYIYENGNTDNGNTNKVQPQEPPGKLRTLDEYRARYASYRAEPDLQTLHRRQAMIWVWDDHEFVNDAWREGSSSGAHDDAEDGPFADRAATALQAPLEWMPIRSPDPAEPLRIYRDFAFGDLADLLMIDTRRIGRDAPPESNALFEGIGVVAETSEAADPARQLLGAEQAAWLAERLATRTARWRLLGNQVMFSPLKLVGAVRASRLSLYMSADKWDGYFAARDRVLAMMRATGNVIVLTGDAHESYTFEVTDDPNNLLAYGRTDGRGAAAVEFVVPSITSRGDPAEGNSLTRRVRPCRRHLRATAAGAQSTPEVLRKHPQWLCAARHHRRACPRRILACAICQPADRRQCIAHRLRSAQWRRPAAAHRPGCAAAGMSRVRSSPSERFRDRGRRPRTALKPPLTAYRRAGNPRPGHEGVI